MHCYGIHRPWEEIPLLGRVVQRCWWRRSFGRCSMCRFRSCWLRVSSSRPSFLLVHHIMCRLVLPMTLGMGVIPPREGWQQGKLSIGDAKDFFSRCEDAWDHRGTEGRGVSHFWCYGLFFVPQIVHYRGVAPVKHDYFKHKTQLYIRNSNMSFVARHWTTRFVGRLTGTWTLVLWIYFFSRV